MSAEQDADTIWRESAGLTWSDGESCEGARTRMNFQRVVLGVGS